MALINLSEIEQEAEVQTLMQNLLISGSKTNLIPWLLNPQCIHLQNKGFEKFFFNSETNFKIKYVFTRKLQRTKIRYPRKT